MRTNTGRMEVSSLGLLLWIASQMQCSRPEPLVNEVVSSFAWTGRKGNVKQKNTTCTCMHVDLCKSLRLRPIRPDLLFEACELYVAGCPVHRQKLDCLLRSIPSQSFYCSISSLYHRLLLCKVLLVDVCVVVVRMRNSS